MTSCSRSLRRRSGCASATWIRTSASASRKPLRRPDQRSSVLPCLGIPDRTQADVTERLGLNRPGRAVADQFQYGCEQYGHLRPGEPGCRLPEAELTAAAQQVPQVSQSFPEPERVTDDLEVTGADRK